MNFNIKNTFLNNLPADRISENYRRQVHGACFSYVEPKKTSSPKLIHTSSEVVKAIGLSKKDTSTKKFLNVFTGNSILKNTKPYAMCYGGHQFGQWAGQLGDGRAINLCEVFYNNKQWALQLKGAGETPYSRSADGLAVLRSSIREYLCSEAMYHLGVPTTRALSLALSGDKVLRDIMYNGNPAYEQGAIVCRVAESFIRFGNFEILSAQQNIPILKQLTDYTITHFFKEIETKGTQKYLDFLVEVRNRTIDMIVNWQRVGFVHGVMNTDNMSILGLTIDYGPYGWLDNYDFNFTPNTTDAQHKRYRYGNQPNIGLWNVYKLANSLYPLIEKVQPIQNILDEYEELYSEKYKQMMCRKLGLSSSNKTTDLISSLEELLQLTETDYTIFFRNLSNVLKKDTPQIAITKISDAFYSRNKPNDTIREQWIAWFKNYNYFLNQENLSEEDKKQKMDLVNPKYIPRNYITQIAIDNAEKEDYQLIDDLYNLFKKPYKEQPEHQKWFKKRPEWAKHKIGCSMLSCSS